MQGQVVLRVWIRFQILDEPSQSLLFAFTQIQQCRRCAYGPVAPRNAVLDAFSDFESGAAGVTKELCKFLVIPPPIALTDVFHYRSQRVLDLAAEFGIERLLRCVD